MRQQTTTSHHAQPYTQQLTTTRPRPYEYSTWQRPRKKKKNNNSNIIVTIWNNDNIITNEEIICAYILIHKQQQTTTQWLYKTLVLRILLQLQHNSNVPVFQTINFRECQTNTPTQQTNKPKITNIGLNVPHRAMYSTTIDANTSNNLLELPILLKKYGAKREWSKALWGAQVVLVCARRVK